MTKRTAALVAALLVLPACSTGEQGQPLPDGSGAPGTSTGPSTGAPTSAAALPARPAELPLTGVQPCELFTQPQLTELKVQRTRPTTAGSDQYKGAAVCMLTIPDDGSAVDVRVLLATTEGAEAWLSGRNVDASVTEIDGYGAVHTKVKGGSGKDCTTAVDVAKGQHMQVRLTIPSQGWTQDRLCETTDGVAAAALATLRAR